MTSVVCTDALVSVDFPSSVVDGMVVTSIVCRSEMVSVDFPSSVVDGN